LGLGAGLGLHTKTGLLKLAFTNGSAKDQNQFQQYHSSTHLQYQILSQFIKDQT
jgi:hypothetical protein